MMKSLAPALLLLMAAPATAQVPSTEHVTVTGTRSRAVLQDFVQSLASPGRITGKLARWEDGVCPVTVGLKPQYADFISRRIKDVAAQVGAPVNARPSCKPNIEIVFTTKPQALADRMRREDQLYLGYHDNSSQADALATVRHPIQAWYTTGDGRFIQYRGRQQLAAVQLRCRHRLAPGRRQDKRPLSRCDRGRARQAAGL
jgi:hypothetical protein